MSTYYRVKKDTPLWVKGAILEHNGDKGSDGGYDAIEDIWDAMEHHDYLTTCVIEDPANAKFFERVYKDDISGKLFKTKDQMLEIYSTAFKG